MKILNYNEYVSQNETLNEGFLNNLKTAIKRVVKDPKQYIDDNFKRIHGKLEKDFAFEVGRFYKENKEEIVKELENLCNDKDLKTIYNYMKSNSDKFVNDKDCERPYDSKYYMSYIDEICHSFRTEEARKKLKKNIRDNMFKDASDVKCFAVLEIMYAFYHGYFKKKEKEKIDNYVSGLHNKKSSSSYYSSSSDDDTTFFAGVAAGLAAM